jgi:predicted MFS family arabinose efflux permease
VREPPVAAAGEAPTTAGLDFGSIHQAIARVLRHPRMPLATLIWIYAFGMMAFMAMNGVVALYLERAFEVTKESIGWFYVYVGGVSTLMRAFVLGPVVRRLGDVRTLRLGALSVAVGLGTLPLATNLWNLALVALFVPVGTALLFPATTSLVSQQSRPSEVGQNLGVQQAFGGVSRMLGPLWATAAFQYLSIASPFWIACGLMLIVAGIAWTVRSGEPSTESPTDAEGFAEIEPSAPEGL